MRKKQLNKLPQILGKILGVVTIASFSPISFMINKNVIKSVALGIICSILMSATTLNHDGKIISPLAKNFFAQFNQPAKETSPTNEVFGFAPYWNMSKFNSIDFNVLTTLAYFDAKIDADGNIQTDDPGWQTYLSPNATRLFERAHQHGTRVVLTMTLMDQDAILSFLDNRDAQNRAVAQLTTAVKDRGIDGLNVDVEYFGDENSREYQNKFSSFIANLTTAMHDKVHGSKVTTSVYASAAVTPRIYDLFSLAKNSDGIFMMGYDFATTSSDIAMPTAPLYGYKQKKYWYDISTAVDDFLKQMPANKLILGLPWYGYDYPVYQPTVKAETLPWWDWGGSSSAETYGAVKQYISNPNEVSNVKTGWDDVGQVGYIAYVDNATGNWRMIFLEDTKSLSKKYDFAINRKLKGVGIWAMGMENGRTELWDLLAKKFGTKSQGIIISKINP